MIRLRTRICLVFAVLCFAAATADQYTLTADATKATDQITVTASVSMTKADGTTQTLASPRLTVKEGSNASMVVGQEQRAPNGAIKLPDSTVYNGVKFYVFSIKDSDKVLIVAAVMKEGAIVWADSTTASTASK